MKKGQRNRVMKGIKDIYNNKITNLSIHTRTSKKLNRSTKKTSKKSNLKPSKLKRDKKPFVIK